MGRKEMFYLTTHSTHLRLYGIGYMVEDHSDSERGNPLLPHGLLFPINSTYHSLCYTSQGALAGTPKWELDQGFAVIANNTTTKIIV